VDDSNSSATCGCKLSNPLNVSAKSIALTKWLVFLVVFLDPSFSILINCLLSSLELYFYVHIFWWQYQRLSGTH
jgi:hypothetical protein